MNGKPAKRGAAFIANTYINVYDSNDRSGGIIASQVIRLIGNIYSQINAFLYPWGTSAIVSLQSLGYFTIFRIGVLVRQTQTLFGQLNSLPFYDNETSR